MAAKLPFKYTGAVVLGSNISGTICSVIYILTTMFSSSLKTAAIYYFIGALFVLLACFDTYFALPLNVSSPRPAVTAEITTLFCPFQRFYRYHELMHEKEAEKSRRIGGGVTRRPPYWAIFKQAFPQLFNVFFIFFITLTLFPTVQSGNSVSARLIPNQQLKRFSLFRYQNLGLRLPDPCQPVRKRFVLPHVQRDSDARQLGDVVGAVAAQGVPRLASSPSSCFRAASASLQLQTK